MKRPRRNHSAKFKATVALAAIRGEKTLVELSEQYKVHPNQIGQWRMELLERAAEVFATAAEKRDAGPDVKTLHAKIGQLALENDFWPARARSHRRCERKTMIDAMHELPIVRQAHLLDLVRSTVYYQPQPTSDTIWR